MFAKSIKKNGHFRAGMHIPHEGVDLGEVSADKLAVLKSDASIVLSETAFDSAPAATAPAETAPAETAPAETAPAETAPAAKAPAAKAVNKAKGK